VALGRATEDGLAGAEVELLEEKAKTVAAQGSSSSKGTGLRPVAIAGGW
jgi:hypothetical protein